MRFQIRTRPNGEFVECICQGNITGLSIVEAIAELRQIDGYSDGLNALWDFRQADLSAISVEDMRFILDYMEKTPKRESVRIALLVSKGADVVLLKLWTAVSVSMYGKATRVFLNHDEACQWLDEGNRSGE